MTSTAYNLIRNYQSLSNLMNLLLVLVQLKSIWFLNYLVHWTFWVQANSHFRNPSPTDLVQLTKTISKKHDFHYFNARLSIILWIHRMDYVFHKFVQWGVVTPLGKIFRSRSYVSVTFNASPMLIYAKHSLYCIAKPSSVLHDYAAMPFRQEGCLNRQKTCQASQMEYCVSHEKKPCWRDIVCGCRFYFFWRLCTHADDYRLDVLMSEIDDEGKGRSLVWLVKKKKTCFWFRNNIENWCGNIVLVLFVGVVISERFKQM